MATPVALSGPWGTAPVQSVATGKSHSILVTPTAAYATGSNTYGQLSLGSSADSAAEWKKCKVRGELPRSSGK